MHKTPGTNIKFLKLLPALMLAGVLLLSCGHPQQQPLFQSLSPAAGGVRFSNTIREDDSTHSFIDEFGYMGGGVGIGDFNNDGLKDIFFTGNQVSCRLYINKGENKFEDITIPAGYDDTGYSTHAVFSTTTWTETWIYTATTELLPPSRGCQRYGFVAVRHWW